MADYRQIESALIHGGIFGDELTRSVNTPIYQTSTYQQPELGTNPKWEYSRTGNPTRAALEALIAELEGGGAGFAFASGMAAITAVLQLFQSGDKVLISSNVYGGTYRILDKVFKPFGLNYGIVDTSDPAALDAAITEDVAAILVESPANPLMTVTDLAGVSRIAHAHGVLSIVDNTFMTPYDSMQALIGNTPLVRLNHQDLPDGVNLYAKLELFNPAGSVKDRIGKSMIEDAERRGILKPGGAIVEATAGNTGLGIAFAALKRGYRVILVVPTKFSQEKQTLLWALGADVVNTPREEGMLGAEARANALRATIPGAISLEQFHNPANPLAHYETTGPEIWRDLEGRIDYFVAGAGSGGTYSGIMRYLKEQDPAIQGVLADPVGSTMGGGEHADYDIEGIGNDFIPDTMDMSLVDQVVKVTDNEAFRAARTLARTEGIFAGSSSGGALAAAKKLILGGARGNIVVVFPDRGDRYFSKGLYR